MRIWQNPLKFSGLGVRFINRITLPGGEVGLGDYLQVPPHPPEGLDLEIMGFFHKDSLLVAGYPYVINIVKTFSRPRDRGSMAAG